MPGALDLCFIAAVPLDSVIARLEAAQRFGYEDSNSVFFVPEQQGNARLFVQERSAALGRGERGGGRSRPCACQLSRRP